METPLAETLSKEDKSDFAKLETRIREGNKTFREVGFALMEIRERRLYREEFNDFEEYCKIRWDFERAHAYRLIDSAGVVSTLSETLSPMGDISRTNGVADIPLPMNERQARALTHVPEEKLREVWDKVVTTAPEGVITAEHVEKVAKKYKKKGGRRRQKPETPAEVSVKDGEGQEVPPGLRRIFEYVPDFKEAIDHINSAMSIIRDLSKVQAGRFLSAAQVEVDLKNAKEAIHFTIPHAICPICRGSAKERKEKCPCGQTGFVTKATWEKIPPEKKVAS